MFWKITCMWTKAIDTTPMHYHRASIFSRSCTTRRERAETSRYTCVHFVTVVNCTAWRIYDVKANSSAIMLALTVTTVVMWCRLESPTNHHTWPWLQYEQFLRLLFASALQIRFTGMLTIIGSNHGGYWKMEQRYLRLLRGRLRTGFSSSSSSSSEIALRN